MSNGNNSVPNVNENGIAILDQQFLSQELEVAKQYIKDLEKRLEKRENELRQSEQQLKKSFRKKKRREGVLWHQRLQNDNTIEEVVQAEHDKPLGEYAKLVITGFKEYQDASYTHTTSNSVPFYIRSLIGKTFVIGPQGATIGYGDGCGIKLSADSGVQRFHASIRLTRNNSNGLMSYVLVQYEHTKYVNELNQCKSEMQQSLHANCVFQTGPVAWKLKHISANKLLPSLLFAAIRQNNTELFLQTIEQLKGSDNFASSPFNINREEDKDFMISCDTNSNNDSKNDYIHITDNNETADRYPLLHVAVDYGKIRIVEKILQCGSNVNLQCNLKSYSPLHIAAKHNNMDILLLLIANGADISLKDSIGNDALNLAEHYTIKKLVLESIYFCSAAQGNDIEEMSRILKNPYVNVDVKGFRGYTALHLACLNGYHSCVEFLLQHKASVHSVSGKHSRTALHHACLADDMSVVELLLHYGADPTVNDTLGYSPIQLCHSVDVCKLIHKGEMSLCLASQIGQKDEVQQMLYENTIEKNFTIAPELLRKKISTRSYGRKTSRQMIFENLGVSALVDQKNDKSLAPIHIAAAAGNIEILQILLSYGAKVDLPGGIEKQTALFYSSLAGHVECTNFLMMIGIDHEYCDARGMQCIDHVEDSIKQIMDEINQTKLSSTSTLLTSTKGHDDVETIIPGQFIHKENLCAYYMNTESELRSRLHYLNNVLNVLQSDQQKLFHALRTDDMNSLTRLLQEDEVNLNQVLCKDLPITALNYAASMGMDLAIKPLLSHNANPYIQDSQSYAPIHTAADSGYTNVMKIFIDYGVNVNLQTGLQKYTCLHIAARKNRRSVVELLIRKGADRNLKDAEGKTAFDISTDGAIQSLLATGDERLFVAVQQNNVLLVKELLKTIDINTNFRDHITSLHIACERGSLAMCCLLIESGAYVNVLGGSDYATPLHYAVRSETSDIVYLLIENGATVSIKDNNSKTPFEVATNNRNRRALIEAKRANILSSFHHDLQDEICQICLTNSVDTIILPCQHSSFCATCVSRITQCALDREPIIDVLFVSNNNGKNAESIESGEKTIN